ncbi:MAG: thiolase domain-containing protein, partial [Leucobacter sp.]|nr:thiolase domain-containing protein [Leucobacter sp.]
MNGNVWVIGAHQTDFARNIVREGGDFGTLTAEVVDATLANAAIGPEQIEVIHLGNAFGELFAGQAQLGAMPATVRQALWG